MMERTKKKSLGNQLRAHVKKSISPENPLIYSGNSKIMIHTGSTLLDLAIAGKVKRGGGIPGGILMEVFGPEGSGKTVLLCEIGGAIQRLGGDNLFNDPEARLNSAFAKVNGLDIGQITIEEPDTVTEVFDNIRKWVPKGKGKINGILTDSLAALSTSMEMEKEDGDKMGMRRAKEFSEGLRKVCRILKQENYIMACSNQIRQNADAVAYGEQFTVPGGKAIAFYSSLRLRFFKPEKVMKVRKIRGKDVKDAIGTKVQIEVYKNSCDRPYRKCFIYIDFRYGIDDIRANLQFLKDFSYRSMYTIDEIQLDKSIDESIRMVENEHLEADLREAVIDLWEEIEQSFETKRKQKERV
jgi:recombination protein RecA